MEQKGHISALFVVLLPLHLPCVGLSLHNGVHSQLCSLSNNDDCGKGKLGYFCLLVFLSGKCAQILCVREGVIYPCVYDMIAKGNSISDVSEIDHFQKH